MQKIIFSHRYKKMPPKLSPTFIRAVTWVHRSELTENEIKQDTEIVDGTFYKLPRGKLILIELWTEGHKWSTMRRWTPEKFEYYSSLVGQQVIIKIEPEL